MIHLDRRGERHSTDSAQSVAIYDQVLEMFNGFRLDPLAALQPALDADPDYISGHLMQAALLLSVYDAQVLPMAQASLAAAAASRHQATERERSLHAALLPWANGKLDKGHRDLDRHLLDHPRDLLALQLAHLGDVALGRTMMLHDRIARAWPSWGTGDAGYGYLLGMKAFGLEENGQYALAEELGRRAVELEPRDAWAVHAVAHVCQMQGRAAEGIEWLNRTRPDWSQDNGMAVHNFWHTALMYLTVGDRTAVLRLYDQCIAPKPESLVLDYIDSTALLWRLKLLGIDVGDRWRVIASYWKTSAALGFAAFTDAHAALAFAAVGDVEGLSAMESQARTASEGRGSYPAWGAVVVPLCQALTALVSNAPGRCAELLVPLLSIGQVLGGSHAQRQILLLTAREAAIRSGRGEVAAALEAQRQSTHVMSAWPGSGRGALAAG
ncbi:MAG: tetratricopeptide repeat protein [Burkholderiaceae bacterium]